MIALFTSELIKEHLFLPSQESLCSLQDVVSSHLRDVETTNRPGWFFYYLFWGSVPRQTHCCSSLGFMLLLSHFLQFQLLTSQHRHYM